MQKAAKNFVKKFEKGQTIFTQSDKGSTMFIIHSGRIRLKRKIAGQDEDLGILEKGDFFGEMSLLEDLPRTATAIAEEDLELIEIDRKGFLNLLKSNVEIPIRMIRKYALKLEEMNRKFEYLLQNKREYDKGIREIITQIRGGTESSEKPSEEENIIAYLKSPDRSHAFKITKEATLVGRVDPVTNIIPDIDLTTLDVGRTVSRRHARLTFLNNTLNVIEELGVTNGTFVNDTKLNSGELKPLADGDKLKFGKVELVFHKIN
jgi:CRP-like cAMP-binding protein